MPRYTREGFIERSIKKYGDRFDYSKFEYNGMNEKSCFICKKHGEFWTTPQVHILSSTGCPKCGKERVDCLNTLTTEEFIEKAKSVHGEKYDYSKVVYKKSMVPVIITCREHGDFVQTPNNHLKGHGCPLCASRQAISQDEFIAECKRIYGGRYSFEKTRYLGMNVSVTVTCPKHGDFNVLPKTLLTGSGCPICERERIFIERAAKKYGGKYDYSKVVYKNGITPVCIVDREHGEFWQKPMNHLKGTGNNIVPSQYEHCASVAKKYSFVYDFYIKDRKQYYIAKKNGWLSGFEWLKSDGILEMKNRLIYVYEFNNGFAYVGLTNDIKRRDRQHRGISWNGKKKAPKHDSLYQYSEETGNIIPEPKILEESLTVEEAKLAENKWMKNYSDNGWTLINKCPGGSVGSSLDFCGKKDNIEKLITEITSYKSGEEVRRENRSLYNKMVKYGLGKICFPQNAKRKSNVYTEDFIKELVKKYPSKKTLRENDCGAYQYFWEHGLLDRFYPRHCLHPENFSKKGTTTEK